MTPRLWWAAASAAAMIFGSLLPWARALFFSFTGLDLDYGWVTFLGGLLAAAMLVLYLRRGKAQRWPVIVMAVAGLAGLVSVALLRYAISDTNSGSGDADELFGDVDLVQAGSGLYVSGLASLSLLLASIVVFRREVPDRDRPNAAPGATTPAPREDDVPPRAAEGKP